MNAWKCDICGGLYDDADINSPENRIDPFTGEEIKFYRKELVVRDYRMRPKKMNYNSTCSISTIQYSGHDVCPDCMKKIEDFCRLIRVKKEMERNA